MLSLMCREDEEKREGGGGLTEFFCQICLPNFHKGSHIWLFFTSPLWLKKAIRAPLYTSFEGGTFLHFHLDNIGSQGPHFKSGCQLLQRFIILRQKSKHFGNGNGSEH